MQIRQGFMILVMAPGKQKENVVFPCKKYPVGVLGRNNFVIKEKKWRKYVFQDLFNFFCKFPSSKLTGNEMKNRKKKIENYSKTM